MGYETPSFWWKKHSAGRFLLAPAAALYAHFSARALSRAQAAQINAPVLCLGNFTLGGAGKTPLAVAFAKAAKKRGLRPGIVSRGFGGSLGGGKHKAHLVNAEQDRAREAGDEPLLLAEAAPTAIGANRAAAAEKLLQNGVNFIIMDDGFQSRRLHYDYALLAVDSLRGLGNGRVFPAGPLRAPLAAQLARCDGVIVLGECAAGSPGEAALRSAARAGKPVFQAGLRSFVAHGYAPASAQKQDKAEEAITGLRGLRGRRFLAFAGIGNPDKFYAAIEAQGGIVAQKRSFADHHFFSRYDMEDIAQSAKAQDLILATTAKDYVRLKTEGLEKITGPLLALDIRPEFAQEDFCPYILDCCIAAYKNRRIQ